MRVLFCILALSLAAFADDSFVVEKLTSEESAQLRAAQKTLQEVSAKIRQAHGEGLRAGQSLVTADCGPKYTKFVQLKGDYALIDIEEFNPCASTIAMPFSVPNK